MKKEEENGKKPEYINYSEEEQLLDLNELKYGRFKCDS